jgi:hypothetical protein
MKKRTKEIELSTSTTLHDAQLSHSLSPFAFHTCHFRFFTPIHHRRNWALFHRYTPLLKSNIVLGHPGDPISRYMIN